MFFLAGFRTIYRHRRYQYVTVIFYTHNVLGFASRGPIPPWDINHKASILITHCKLPWYSFYSITYRRNPAPLYTMAHMNIPLSKAALSPPSSLNRVRHRRRYDLFFHVASYSTSFSEDSMSKASSTICRRLASGSRILLFVGTSHASTSLK